MLGPVLRARHASRGACTLLRTAPPFWLALGSAPILSARLYSQERPAAAGSAEQTAASELITDKSVEERRPPVTPIAVELLHHDPIKLPTTHGHLVGRVAVTSFISLRDVQFLSNFLLRAAFYLGIPAKGPTPIKREYERWTVIRGPFAHAKSKENFERVTWGREIKLYDANPGVLQILYAIASKHTMAGVSVHADVVSWESPEESEAAAAKAIEEITRASAETGAAPTADRSEAPSREVADAAEALLREPRFQKTLE